MRKLDPLVKSALLFSSSLAILLTGGLLYIGMTVAPVKKPVASQQNNERPIENNLKSRPDIVLDDGVVIKGDGTLLAPDGSEIVPQVGN